MSTKTPRTMIQTQMKEQTICKKKKISFQFQVQMASKAIYRLLLEVFVLSSGDFIPLT